MSFHDRMMLYACAWVLGLVAISTDYGTAQAGGLILMLWAIVACSVTWGRHPFFRREKNHA